MTCSIGCDNCAKQTVTNEERILARIQQEPVAFSVLYVHMGGPSSMSFRHVDRLLQQLRKAGRIKFNRITRKWEARTT